MKIEDNIRDYYIEAAKISESSSGKIDKYEYLTGGEVLPSDQSKITEQAKFTFLLLVKHLKNK